MQKRLSLKGKPKVIQRAIERGVGLCARQHGAHLSTAYGWLQQRNIMEQIPSRWQKNWRNIVFKQKGTKHSLYEQEVSLWVSCRWQMRLTVSHIYLQIEMIACGWPHRFTSLSILCPRVQEEIWPLLLPLPESFEQPTRTNQHRIGTVRPLNG